MDQASPGRARRARRFLLAGTLALASAASLLPANVFAVGDTLEGHRALPDRDARVGRVAPTTAQRDIARAMGAAVVWNDFGTPHSLIRYGGFLATGLQGNDAASVARAWVTSKKSLFRLGTVTTSNLETLAANRLTGSNGWSVLLRQRFGTLPAAHDGLITVAVVGTKARGWKVAYVSSSSAGTQAAPAPATLTPQAGWLRAAKNVGRTVLAADVKNIRRDHSWTIFDVKGFSHAQRSRLVALPRPGKAVVAAYETIVLDADGGRADAYTQFVDARSGAVLVRINNEQQLADAAPQREAATATAPRTSVFTGAYTDDTGAATPNPTKQACGPRHGPYTAVTGDKSIAAVAAAAVETNDIVLNLRFGATAPTSTVVTSSDNATSPEPLLYEPAGGVPPGNYWIEVCPFGTPTVPPVPPYNYAGNITISEVESETFIYPPKWRYFRANPKVDNSDTDIRKFECWDNAAASGDIPQCFVDPRKNNGLRNTASRAPWDHIVNTNTPSFTTMGNNAISSEAWISPLTPAEQYRPVSLDRSYDYPWTDQWNNSKCSPTVFATPERNDINAALATLFVDHNRMHDFSYFLGFTERTYNLQVNNFGDTSPSRENDPEVGNAQAGAISGGAPTYRGRDNANQITLNDGIPGITNMYLWQPIASGFYADCSDGDYDMSVIAHEYGHAVQNRMVAGPDAGLSGDQASSMGESWSDLTAIEYLSEFSFYDEIGSTLDPSCGPVKGLNPFAVGPYVTGSPRKGIRNYGMNCSPLNYSNLRYDPNGVTSPHADGEIWSAVNFDIRQKMMAKYNASFPASDKLLQRRCADGRFDADACPGNRRWIQIFMDAFLLQPSAVSMVDARNAYLAADLMRAADSDQNWPNNQALMWDAFAKRGLGEGAASLTNDDSREDGSPIQTISFKALTRSAAQHAQIKFQTVAAPGETGTPKARIYVGKYEARAVPIADTDPATPLSDKALFVPGTYEFVAVAPGYGHFRFTRTLAASSTQTLLQAKMPRNWASSKDLDGTGPAVGAKVVLTNSNGVNRSKLLDDTETTNWRANDATGIGGASPEQVTVDLSGGQRLVGKVRVSAFLRPQSTEDPGDPEDVGDVGDVDPQSRFSALRQFEILTCTAGAANANCTTAAGFTKIYTSPTNAFPSGQPRPLAPDLTLREFDVPDTMATHVRLRVVNNQCTGGPEYQGDQDNDPLNDSDCKTSANADIVRAAELQVISQPGVSGSAQDPVVALTMSGPLTGDQGQYLTYTLSYTNLGPAASSNAVLTDTLPAGLNFRSATGNGTYDATTRKVTWQIGTVPVGVTGTVQLVARVDTSVPTGTTLLNQAAFTAPLTVSNPAAVATLIL